MALPANFLDELRTRTPLATVVGRRVRLARSGKQWKGCCPFHGEKSPSFYVYDDGYHCFGCGAHGDAISFVMQSQGLSFMEAVGQLAAEAGLDVPKPTPEAAEAERRRLDVVGVLEAVQAHYQRRLGLPEGRVARDYLLGRGLTEETIARFGLGWAGDRGALTADLSRQGVEIEQLANAGLIRRDDETGRTFELFSQRVMFPIRDRRGMIISFGGRILGVGQPKYVNGPETSVFSKRRNLYGLNLARDGVRNGGTLIVVEGYMDVIATAQAGFTAAAAPVLDLAIPGAHDVIGDRAFGSDPVAVARLGRAVANGLLAAGVVPIGKHVPGHGRAGVDSHLALPRVDHEDMDADIRPFALNADLPWMMTAHIVYRAIDPIRPATLSGVVIGQVIRGRIGFNGVLVTDDLAMQALSGAPADRAVEALQAGCDLALYCAGDLAANEALLRAVPGVTDQARQRLHAARNAAACRRMASLRAEVLAAERDRILA